MDLFVSLDYTKFAEQQEEIEGKLAEMIACRHEYPMWPHGDGPLDSFEEALHGPLRHWYYRATIHVLSVVRTLRELG